MAQVLVYTDPHLGLKRQANFTPASCQAREKESLKSLTKLLRQAKKDRKTVFCLGDFFDKSTNSEEVILSTIQIAKLTDVILSGNHDVANNVDRASSLRLVSEVTENVVFANLRSPSFDRRDLPGTVFYFIGHVLDQQDFEKVMVAAKEDADKVEQGVRKVLCLHCNYGMSKELMESSLVLERSMAADLLTTFNQIWIGHEHNRKTDFDERVKLIGSWRPTAFDNMTHKWVLNYDTMTGETSWQQVWNYIQSSFIGPASACQDQEDKQYFDLFDDLGTGEAQREAVRLLKDKAFGVRVRQEEKKEVEEAVNLKCIETLPDIIKADIASTRPDLLKYFEELIQEEM